MERLTSIIFRISALVLTGLCSAPENVCAIDPPHSGRNSPGMSISCNRCHYGTTGPTPSWATQQTTTDETFFNNLCTDCHRPTAMTDSRFVVKTHSSGNTSNKYGNWSIECRTCHNPHYQDQVSGYPLDPNADLLTGTIGPFAQPPVSAAETIIPVVGGGLVENAWIDHTFVPNTAYPIRMYRIKSNTASSITVYGPVNGRYAAPGSAFAIRLGKMLFGQIATPYTGQKQVKFFRESGIRSFGTSTDPADMTSICQVCHVSTSSFNNAGTLEGPGHPALQAGGNCTQCHTHASGFKSECGSCHGNPPVVNTPGGPDGLANNEGGTGASTPGAHGRHAVSLGYDCTTCHESGMPASTIYDKKIQIGFHIAGGAYQTGSYDGRAVLVNGYTYTAGNAGTSIAQNGTMTCIAVYCHSNGTSVSTGTVPSSASPNWAAGMVSCSSCHGYPPDYENGSPKANSHAKHADRAFGCNECHAGTTSDGATIANAANHVNRAYDVHAGAAGDFTYSYAAGGGACSTISCHNNGSATWGSFACDSCHECPPPTGSHAKHFGTAARYSAAYGDTRIAQDISGTASSYIMNCGNCHPLDPAKHSDGAVEMELYSSLSPSGSLKSRNLASAAYLSGGTVFTDGRGFPYTQGTCKDVYCHSYNDWTTPGGVPESTNCASSLPPNLVTTRYYRTATWGSGALTCSGCHGNAPGTAYPANDGGSGDSHFWKDGYGYGNLHNYNMGYAPISCSYCHNETIRTQNTWTRDAMDVATQDDVPIDRYTKHVNGTVDVAFDKSNAFPYSTPYSLASATYAPSTKTCSNVSCHQDQTTVTWGTPYRYYYQIECDRCHNFSGQCP